MHNNHIPSCPTCLPLVRIFIPSPIPPANNRFNLLRFSFIQYSVSTLGYKTSVVVEPEVCRGVPFFHLIFVLNKSILAPKNKVLFDGFNKSDNRLSLHSQYLFHHRLIHSNYAGRFIKDKLNQFTISYWGLCRLKAETTI